MKKIIFLMLFATLGWQHAIAQSFTAGGIAYNITSPTTVSVAYQSGTTAGAVTIPAQVTDNSVVYSVTTISNGAFFECFNLTSIIIPDSVTSLVTYAFGNCSSLTSVSISNSVTSIG